jgi:hypothetical protein
MKGGTAAWAFARRPDFAVLKLHDFVRDRQAEAGRAFACRGPSRETLEALKEAGEILRRETVWSCGGSPAASASESSRSRKVISCVKTITCRAWASRTSRWATACRLWWSRDETGSSKMRHEWLSAVESSARKAAIHDARTEKKELTEEQKKALI